MLTELLRALFRLPARLRFIHVLTLVIVAVVAASLWYSNRLVRQLAAEERDRLLLYREVLRFIATHDNAETEFLFNNIVRERSGGPGSALVKVPAIITDSTGNPITDNLELPPTLTRQQRETRLRAELESMQQDAAYPPIRVAYAPGQVQLIYYRESNVLKALRFYPYITLAVIAIVLLGVFYNFYNEQRNRQNKVWAGLAKETAHQLGTPLSGLMAWVEILRLKARDEEDNKVVEEIERDVIQLQHITERFSKIGSAPEIDYHPLLALLDKSIAYVRARAGRAGKVQILLETQLSPAYEAPLNPILFEWVIENLLKNALDALGAQSGTITLRAEAKGARLVLEVEDTGKGIAQRNIKDVFKPGFTTKKRGWGLGLSLSKRIVENYHGGRITVRRTEMGRGTTFRISLPAYLRGRRLRDIVLPDNWNPSGSPVSNLKP